MLYPKENRAPTLDQENLIDTICGHLATALEREALEETARRTEVYEQSERLHQALLNTVSHELRTPLTTIIGGASALKDVHSPEIIDSISEAAGRLNQTIENLMDMSRVSSGVLKLNAQIFELNDFVRSVLERRTRLT